MKGTYEKIEAGSGPSEEWTKDGVRVDDVSTDLTLIVHEGSHEVSLVMDLGFCERLWESDDDYDPIAMGVRLTPTEMRRLHDALGRIMEKME